MRPILVAALALGLLTFLATPVLAHPDAPVCVGYADCYRYGGSFAFVCYENPLKGGWTCGYCEACGNPI